jgi:hypothetical protein
VPGFVSSPRSEATLSHDDAAPAPPPPAMKAAVSASAASASQDALILFPRTAVRVFTIAAPPNGNCPLLRAREQFAAPHRRGGKPA